MSVPMDDGLSYANISDGIAENTMVANQRRKSDDARCTDALSVYGLVLDVYLTIPVALLGILGNVFVVCILCSRCRREFSIIVSLAVTDTLFLIVNALFKVSARLYACHQIMAWFMVHHTLLFRLGYPVGFVLRMNISWLTTLLSFSRWASLYPAAQTSRATKCFGSLNDSWKMVIIFIMSGVISIPRFMEFDMSSERLKYLEHVDDIYYTFIYKVTIFAIFMYILPIVFVTFYNVKFYTLVRRDSYAGSSPRAEVKTINTAITFIVLIFIICNVPPLVGHILYSVESALHPDHIMLRTARRYVSISGNFMVTANSAANFTILFCSSRSMRRDMCRALLALCRCVRKRTRTDQMVRLSPSSSDELMFTVIRETVV